MPTSLDNKVWPPDGYVVRNGAVGILPMDMAAASAAQPGSAGSPAAPVRPAVPTPEPAVPMATF